MPIKGFAEMDDKGLLSLIALKTYIVVLGNDTKIFVIL